MIRAIQKEAINQIQDTQEIHWTQDYQITLDLMSNHDKKAPNYSRILAILNLPKEILRHIHEYVYGTTSLPKELHSLMRAIPLPRTLEAKEPYKKAIEAMATKCIEKAKTEITAVEKHIKSTNSLKWNKVSDNQTATAKKYLFFKVGTGGDNKPELNICYSESLESQKKT